MVLVWMSSGRCLHDGATGRGVRPLRLCEVAGKQASHVRVRATTHDKKLPHPLPYLAA